MYSLDTFFQAVLGKPALCFAQSAASAQPPLLESQRALNELGEDGKRSAVLLENLCDMGDGKSCLAVGLMTLEGSGVKQDFEKSATLLGRACARKNAKGCFFLGRLHEGMQAQDGTRMPANSSKAYESFRLACAGGVGEGCYNVGQMLDQGKVKGDKQDASKKLHKRVAKV